MLGAGARTNGRILSTVICDGEHRKIIVYAQDGIVCFMLDYKLFCRIRIRS
jgi:hypothetical protein